MVSSRSSPRQPVPSASTTAWARSPHRACSSRATAISITGQDLTLVGPQSTIRVGDGTALGLGYTATIDAALIGSTQLIKADLGTLVLTGTNTYTGGTQLDAGTLRISSDANLGDAAGGLVFNGGTLNTTADLASNRAVTLLGAGTLSTDAGTTLSSTVRSPAPAGSPRPAPAASSLPAPTTMAGTSTWPRAACS